MIGHQTGISARLRLDAPPHVLARDSECLLFIEVEVSKKVLEDPRHSNVVAQYVGKPATGAAFLREHRAADKLTQLHKCRVLGIVARQLYTAEEARCQPNVGHIPEPLADQSQLVS